MKKIFAIFTILLLVVSCTTSEEQILSNELILKGYADVESRTAFGNPDENKIPYLWSSGDYIWLGSVKSNPIAEDCLSAQFKWQNTPSTIDAYHLFYNMTAEANNAKVLAEQSADGNLGNDGDFGYALADEFGVFVLEHKTAYIWFDTTSSDVTAKLLTISVTAPEGVNIAGECSFDYRNDAWSTAVVNGSNSITLNFGDGVELQSSNSGVFASMVTLPAAVDGKNLTILYTFADGTTFTEVKSPKKDLAAGATQRVATAIAAADLVVPMPEPEPEPTPDPELPYELRVLTFEDADVKFSPFLLDYADFWVGREITKWSELIDNPQYSGPLLYGNDAMDAMYYWYDEGNTELYHLFPDNYAYCFWGGGHAISNYWGAGYADEDRNAHILKYYGQEYLDQWAGKPGADGALGWFLLQLMVPVAPHSGENFCVHYGYKDFFSFIENLPEISFFDCEPRVIDHMYVTNTNYTLNQLHNGVKSEEGNSFGGNWSGLQEDAWLKIVAQGFASVDDTEPTSETEFYLVNGFNVVEDWQKWDLSVLGAVAKVRFNFLYSDEMGGKYGFTIPGYFAYDDVAVRFDK